MAAHELQTYLPALLALVKQTGDAILEIYYKSSQFSVRSKPDATPLTQADLIANEVLVAGLHQLTPNWPILSEENPAPSFALRKTWSEYWLIDPLDGTKEFIRHSSDFVISIALIREEKPVLGIIYSPVLDETYYAASGEGAFFLASHNHSPQRIATRSWHKKTTVLVGHYYKVEKIKQVLTSLEPYDVLPMGSALKFCTIAKGGADLYPRLGATSEWDTAAGQIIVEEAGGLVVNFALQPLCYNTKPSLLNPHFLAVGDQRLLSFLQNRGQALCKYQKN